jgi:hypothetical protein
MLDLLIILELHIEDFVFMPKKMLISQKSLYVPTAINVSWTRT